MKLNMKTKSKTFLKPLLIGKGWGWALLLLLLTACGSKYKYDSVKGDDMQTRIYTLDNGLKVYLSVNKEAPRIQTYIAVRTGSKNDPAETTGLAHYLEHLMFKGTKQFGTTNPEAEEPFLNEITERYEAYRQLTDPEARRQAYRYRHCPSTACKLTVSGSISLPLSGYFSPFPHGTCPLSVAVCV